MGALTYLGLGSNEGDRSQHLEFAVARLRELAEPGSLRLSPVYETPALLPEGAPVDWNLPFLNLAVEGRFQASAEELLAICHAIETGRGRGIHQKWSPRPLDIDLLIFGDRTSDSTELALPHPRLAERAFVLDPLKDLNPALLLPGPPARTVLQAARRHPQHAPIWMGIINATPDSFADGGLGFSGDAGQEQGAEIRLSALLDAWDVHFVGVIDVGGESTRPGASPVAPEEEWRRLQPVLQLLVARYEGRAIRPLISVDTRNLTTAERALGLGVDIINDVSGLASPEMIRLLRGSTAQYVLMHSLGIPAAKGVTLSESDDPVAEVLSWFEHKIPRLLDGGVVPSRPIVDPGIGFGKNSLQSLALLRDLERFHALPFRLLIGHSRKSFLDPFTRRPSVDRDLESIGVSLNLITKGVDFLRVHEPVSHIRAFRAWNHVNRSSGPASMVPPGGVQ